MGPILHILRLPALQVVLGGALLIAAALLGAFTPLDNALRTPRFGLVPMAASGNTVFIDIDTASLESVGVWPWPRSVHARLLDELMALGADKVAFDIDFAVASDAAGDAEFERALTDAGGFALLAAFQQQQIGQSAPAVNMPLPRFAAHADPVAVNVNLDADGIVRRYPLGMWLGGTWVPSIAAVFAGLTPTAQGQFGIDYAIDPATVPRISARDLLEHRVPAEAIAGRNVVIGASAVELRDFFVVPGQGTLPGALLQIVATETLQQGRALVGIGLWPEFAILLLLVGLGVWLRTGPPLLAVALSAIGLAAIAEAGAAALQIRAALLLDTAAIHIGLAAIVLTALIDEVRKRGEQHRKATRERDAVRVVLDRVITDNFDGVVIVRDDGEIISASQSAALLLGRPLIGEAAIDVLPAGLADIVRGGFARVAPPPIRELEVDTPAGTRQIEYAATLSSVEIEGAHHDIVSLTFRDITERRAAEDRLLYLSRHDPLTGALTRGALLDEARARLASGTPLSLVMLDLRRFRAINDTLGHNQGDVLLRLAVSRLRNMGPDAVARLGGDSFALLAPVMEPDRLTGYCESIAEWLSFPYQLDNGHSAVVAASAGATTSLLSGDAETMLSQADMALSVAKESVGNTVRLFEPGMDDRLHASQQMDAALREALRLQKLTLAYQPQIDLGTGRIVGAEALSRWTDPGLGIMSPADFVAAAEETGLIVELGAWVLETACREAATWPPHLRIAINVSPVQFELSDVPETIRMALQISGLDPRRLDIEITEGVFVRNATRVTQTLDMIRAMGIGIALDDFGTGYSSLGYLGRLPIDKIKIDQRFVRELPADAESQAIVTAVLNLSQALGKATVAEGIETPAQADLLRLAGCTYGQGFHFGRPMSGQALCELASEPAVSAVA